LIVPPEGETKLFIVCFYHLFYVTISESAIMWHLIMLNGVLV